MDLLRFFRERDRFAAHSGIELEEIRPGYARASLELGEEHLNGVNVVHGGAIFTLADFAFAAASNSHGTIAVAIQASISILRGVSSGRLMAEAVEVSVEKNLGSYTVTVTDEAGEVIAHFQGLAYRKRESHSEFMAGLSKS